LFKKTIKAYLDLTRLHFFFAWPLLFCSGLFLGFQRYGGFDWLLVAKAATIGLLGFEGGFVLNDYVDAELDKKDVEQDKLTRYWRLTGSRPISTGRVSKRNALVLFLLLAAGATALSLTLPYPHSAYVLGIMAYSYFIEYFYQVKKRNQDLPIAQLLGRTDFSLFPVAGYLVNGQPDFVALLYFIFFYPFAEAHLGANDIIDVANDKVKELKTIPILYGLKGTAYWILIFTVVHIMSAFLFAGVLVTVAKIGTFVGIALLIMANVIIMRGQSPAAGLKALPLFHIAMTIYTASIVIGYFV
jgi:4-hydroxybenzoate polyprenyltransferase